MNKTDINYILEKVDEEDPNQQVLVIYVARDLKLIEDLLKQFLDCKLNYEVVNLSWRTLKDNKNDLKKTPKIIIGHPNRILDLMNRHILTNKFKLYQVINREGTEEWWDTIDSILLDHLDVLIKESNIHI